MTAETPAARIRAYLDALPDTVNVGAEFAYGAQFRSDDWPHDSYPLTREDLEQVLADAAAHTEAPVLRSCLLPGCLRQFDLNATMRGRPAEPNRSAEGWKQVRPTVATGYVCPGHAPLMDQHHPRWAERTDAGAVLTCACGWGSPAARWPGYAVAAWQDHLIAAAEAMAPGPAIPPGGNAEDCARCFGTNPPYPFLCPGHPAQEASR